MRGRTIVAFVAVLALAVLATGAALAAPGGEPGKPDNPGRPTQTPGDNHDPANPDGTYRGKSGSTPDQDGIGADHGIVNNDKTGPGTDGNNGCGNDPDREDDNNGWCGKPPAETSPTPTPTTTTPEVEVSPTADVSPTETETETAGAGAEVLGARFDRGGLANTGVRLDLWVAAAIGMLAIGFAVRTLVVGSRG